MSRALALLVPIAITIAAPSCKSKVTAAQCDELLDRYAQLVIQERMKDAPAELVKAEQVREREEARNDDDFKNCTSELSTEDFACAMKAKTADALEKCLE